MKVHPHEGAFARIMGRLFRLGVAAFIFASEGPKSLDARSVSGQPLSFAKRAANVREAITKAPASPVATPGDSRVMQWPNWQNWPNWGNWNNWNNWRNWAKWYNW